MKIFERVPHTETYRRRAQKGEFHRLAGRDKVHTDFVAANILSRLRLAPESAMLDIGCGDGSLLAAAAPTIGRGLGLVPTPEECAYLRREPHPANVAFETGLSASLPVADGAFDIIVMNGVLLILGTLDEADASLREIARAARRGAQIWLGESCVTPPPEPRYEMRHVWRDARRLFKGRPVALKSPLLVTSRAWILEASARHGLRLAFDEPHPMLDRSGRPETSDHRHDFLLVKD